VTTEAVTGMDMFFIPFFCRFCFAFFSIFVVDEPGAAALALPSTVLVAILALFAL